MPCPGWFVCRHDGVGRGRGASGRGAARTSEYAGGKQPFDPARSDISSAGGVPAGDLFTFGQPLTPLGDALASDGVYFKGFWQSTLFSNPSGGVQRGSVVYDEANFGADFDLGKIAGLTGSVIHFDMDSRFGGMPQGVNDFGGSDAAYLSGTGPDNQTRLTELSWDQHLFDDKVRFVVGRFTLADYFATSDLYCQFQVGTCSNIGSFTWSADSNTSFWPIATWAGEVAFFPTPETYLRVGAAESDPYQYSSGGFHGTAAGARPCDRRVHSG